MYQKLRNRTEGFTIIEVLIVLAIAGLIMLIVFLAVPALQRNSRNNARNSDASRVVAGVRECINNRNGISLGSINECQSGGVVAIVGDRSQLTNITFGSGATQAVYDRTTARVVWGVSCDTVGEHVSGTGDYAVTYELEDNVDRCLKG